MKTLIVIPCYNECNRLNKEAFFSFVSQNDDIEFLFVNDGSTDTTSKWFGVTYAADRESTVARIQQLVDEGVYPNKLF